MLTRQQVNEIFKDAKARVQVSCDEYHGHSAIDGCIAPKKAKDKDAVAICKLVEHISQIDRILRPVTAYDGEEREQHENDEEDDG